MVIIHNINDFYWDRGWYKNGNICCQDKARTCFPKGGGLVH